MLCKLLLCQISLAAQSAKAVTEFLFDVFAHHDHNIRRDAEHINGLCVPFCFYAVVKLLLGDRLKET